MTATSIGSALDRAMASLAEKLSSDEDIAAWERDRAAETREELIALSGVRDVLSRKGAEAVIADRCRPTRAVDLVRQWLASKVPALVLFGDIGVGKTVAAAWALSRVPGHYVVANALTRMMRSDYGNPTAEYVRLMRCELLVVDELGIEEHREHAAAMLYDVVNGRQGKRRTLIMGNLDRDAFEKRYDARTISRLHEVGVIRSVKGADLRRGEP